MSDGDVNSEAVRQRLHRITDFDQPRLGDRVVGEGMRQLSLPGQYARGLLAGKPGQKATSEEMLGRPLGPVGKMAWDAATDPLTYAGPGLLKVAGRGAGALREGARALGEGAHANPLVNAMQGFAKGESGKLDWGKLATSLRDPAKRELMRSAGPEEYFARQGVPFADVPARKLEILGDRLGIPVEWKGRDAGSALASYNPGSQAVELPRSASWLNPGKMAKEIAELGTGDRPWLSTADPRHLGTHEMLHALQHREAPDLISYLRSSGGVIDPERAGWLGRNVSDLSRMNPHEAVAEIGAKKVLTPEAIIKPPVERAWAEYGGPNLLELKHALGLR